MKHRIIAMLLTICFLFASFSVGFNATEINHIDVETTEYYEYIQYNFETKEYTTIYIPVENSTQSTWELFDPTQVASMTAAAQQSLNKLETSRNSSRVIIGSDDRFLTPPTTSPYSSVALIITTCYNFEEDRRSTFFGTGFLVSGRVLVTAAHCIAPKDGWELEDIRIYFGMHGHQSQLPNTFIVPLNYTVPSSWYGSDGWKYDYAVIDLYSSISRPLYFNCVLPNNANVGTNITVSGYPGGTEYYYLMSSCGQITYKDSYIWRYNNDILGGMSGGPIYSTSSNSTCYGIVTYQSESGGFNQGNVFTQDAFNLITNRISANQ